MSAALLRRSAAAAAMIMLAIGAVGCVAGGGYGNDDGVGLDYYEPYGGFYGGWGPGYHVGPFRDGGHFGGGARPAAHAYRSAPASHAVPSIPSHARGGGGHGGGGRR